MLLHTKEAQMRSDERRRAAKVAQLQSASGGSAAAELANEAASVGAHP